MSIHAWPRRRSRRHVVRGLSPIFSGVALLLSSLLGLALSRTTDGIAALWPTNAILVSILILSGRSTRRYHLIAGATAGLIANWAAGTDIALSVAFAIANVICAAVTFHALTSRSRADALFETSASLTRFLAASAIGVATGATVAAAASWAASGSFASLWLSWAESDLLGMLLVVPLLVSGVRKARELRQGGQRLLDGSRAWPLMAVLAASIIVFYQSRFPLLFLPLALVMIATYRLGLLGAIAGTAIVAAIGLLSIQTGHGPVALVHGSVALRIQFFQFYLVTLYGASMPLAVLMAERVRLARERGDSERRYRLLADHSNDMIVQLEITGVRRYVSPASLALLGFSPEEMVDQPAAGAIHPDDRAKVIATCRTLLDGTENPICTYRQLHKNGAYVWLEASYRLIRDEATGVPDSFIATVRDINRRAKAELERSRSAAQLEEANRLLLMAEEMSAVGHWRVDVASGMVYWSDMVCTIHGRPYGYLPTVDTAIEAYHPDDRPLIEAAVEAAISHGRGYSMSARIFRTDGVLRHVVMTGRAERGPDGSVTELFGVFQDVTEAYEAQEALVAAGEELASSNKMLTMAEAVANLGHWRIDRAAKSLYWSDETYRIYGVAPSVTPSLDRAYAQYHPDDVDRVRSAIETALTAKTGYHSRARIVRPDGAERHILTRGEIELGADGQAIGMFGTVQDITDQVNAENLRQAQAERYFFITEQASDMISLTDVKGVCHFVSPSAKAILGYEPEEMIGTTPYDYALEEDYPLLDQQRRELTTRPVGEVAPLRFRMRRKDGVYIWMDVAGRVAAHGNETRIISVCRDISAQVAVEEELRNAQRHAEAAASAKSSFLANMSHEIRTPMNGVVGFAELLLAGPLDQEQRRQAELIADSGRAMMRLLNDILDLSKVEAGQMTVASEPFDLVDTLNACMTLVTPVAERKAIALRCDLAGNVPRAIVGDALRVRQIVLNLLGNAAKFTLEGSVTLSTAIDGEGRLAIAVEDTGIGIAADRQQAIFEQFAQADDGIAQRFGGTGLGLAISSRLATLMGGTLTLESEAGRGSRFTLRLPLAAADVQRLAKFDAAPAIAAPHRHDGVRLLVAEDHDVNQLLISAMLKRLGCTSDLATNGHEAIAMIDAAAAEGRPYPLVLMDMQMPSMNGLEATRRIRASGIGAATLPIVALTANAFADDIQACLDAGMQAHIAKPFSLASLADALRRWLPVAAVEAPHADADADLGADLRQRYDARKRETLERVDRLVRTGTFTDVELAEVATMLHQLAGTAGMFGDDALGVEAGELEAGLADRGADLREMVSRAAEAMRRAA